MIAAGGPTELQAKQMPITIDISQSPTLKRLYDEAERDGRQAGAANFCITYSERQGFKVTQEARQSIKLFTEAQSGTFVDAIMDTDDFDAALRAAVSAA
jgi:hypothetical protein